MLRVPYEMKTNCWEENKYILFYILCIVALFLLFIIAI